MLSSRWCCVSSVWNVAVTVSPMLFAATASQALQASVPKDGILFPIDLEPRQMLLPKTVGRINSENNYGALPVTGNDDTAGQQTARRTRRLKSNKSKSASNSKSDKTSHSKTLKSNSYKTYTAKPTNKPDYSAPSKTVTLQTDCPTFETVTLPEPVYQPTPDPTTPAGVLMMQKPKLLSTPTINNYYKYYYNKHYYAKGKGKNSKSDGKKSSSSPLSKINASLKMSKSKKCTKSTLTEKKPTPQPTLSIAYPKPSPMPTSQPKPTPPDYNNGKSGKNTTKSAKKSLWSPNEEHDDRIFPRSEFQLCS
ncbi:hypothetical protein ACA910_006597 [Epithemia clementina (nom. ined.)]